VGNLIVGGTVGGGCTEPRKDVVKAKPGARAQGRDFIDKLGQLQYFARAG
jgi:hypothetical protein